MPLNKIGQNQYIKIKLKDGLLSKLNKTINSCVPLFNSKSIELITYLHINVVYYWFKKELFFTSLYYGIDEKFCDPRLEKNVQKIEETYSKYNNS